MNKSVLRSIILVLLVCVPLWSVADEAVMHKLVFRSGRVVVGEIVVRNDEMVVVKNTYGSRFQYPMSDIVEIIEINNEEQQAPKEEDDHSSRSMTNVKRTSLGFHVAGGMVSLNGNTGGAVAADFRLGANNVARRQIFLGGQVGYRALMVEDKTLSILPISVVMELPLIVSPHAPMLGAHIGYGIGISGVRGGVNAGLALAYRYHFSRTGAFHIGLEAELQQLAQSPHSVTIEPGQSFSSTEGRTAVLGMLCLGVLF